jgi:hypothetical protein
VGGSSAHKLCTISPTKNSSLQKIFGFVFLNLTLHDKKIQENPSFPYAALRAARQKFPESDTSFIRATLYDQIRTYFKQNLE